MARTLQSFLTSPELARIARMAATLRQLDAHWQKRLPAELAQHSRVITWKLERCWYPHVVVR